MAKSGYFAISEIAILLSSYKKDVFFNRKSTFFIKKTTKMFGG